MARYRLRGCMLGPDTLDAESVVLVSVDRLNPEPPTPNALRDRFGLTAREAQVACLLMQRLTNDEIASALGISVKTVEAQMGRALKALRDAGLLTGPPPDGYYKEWLENAERQGVPPKVIVDIARRHDITPEDFESH